MCFTLSSKPLQNESVNEKEENLLANYMTRLSIKSSSQHLYCPKVTTGKEAVPSGMLMFLLNLLFSSKGFLQNQTELDQLKMCH